MKILDILSDHVTDYENALEQAENAIRKNLDDGIDAEWIKKENLF